MPSSHKSHRNSGSNSGDNHHKDRSHHRHKSSKSSSSQHRSGDSTSSNHRERDHKKSSSSHTKPKNITVTNDSRSAQHYDNMKTICDDDNVYDDDAGNSDENVNVNEPENRLEIDAKVTNIDLKDDRKNGQYRSNAHDNRHHRDQKRSKSDATNCDSITTDAKSDSSSKLKRKHSPDKYEISKSTDSKGDDSHHHSSSGVGGGSSSSSSSSGSKIKHESLSHSNSSSSNRNSKDSHTHKSSSNSNKDTHRHTNKSMANDEPSDKASRSQRDGKSSSHHKSSSNRPERRKDKHHSDKSQKSDSAAELTPTNIQNVSSPVQKSSSGSKLSSSPKKPKVEKAAPPVIDCIDSSMGTSFADALGMIIPPSTSKSSSKSKVAHGKPSPSSTVTSSKTLTEMTPKVSV